MTSLSRRTFLRRLAGGALAPLAVGLPGCGPGEGEAPGIGSGSGTAGSAGPDAAAAPELIRASWPGYDDAVIVDGLASPIQFNIPQQTLPLGQAALDQVRRSGIHAVNVTVNRPGTADATAYEGTLARIGSWNRELEAHPDVFRSALTVADIRDARATGRLGLVYGLQDGTPFQDDLGRLIDLHVAGVRIIQPTYNVQNLLGSGCLAPEDAGLTDLGRDAVAAMEDLGILLDLSHCGPRTTRDGIDAATGPVSVTHSGCNAVYRHPRNKDDETLRRVADGGGVVGIYLMPFLNAEGPPTAEDVVRHVEHALDVCGEDHVGIGSDQGIVPLDVSGDFQARFDEVSAQRAAAGIAAPREDTIPYVPQLNHPRRLEALAGLLSERGHPDRVVEKVMGSNFTRLFGEVWG